MERSVSRLRTGEDFRLSEQPLGVALRFFRERLSVDVGFVLVAEVLDEGFPHTLAVFLLSLRPFAERGETVCPPLTPSVQPFLQNAGPLRGQYVTAEVGEVGQEFTGPTWRSRGTRTPRRELLQLGREVF